VRTRFVAHDIVAALLAIASVGAPLAVRGQTASQNPAVKPPAKAAVKAADKPVEKAAVRIKRTPDGQPDIRGIWNKSGGHINEANPPKVSYTEDCQAFFARKAEPTGFNNTEPRPKPQHAPATPPPQGIVDPSDRVLPWRPEAAAWRQDYMMKMGPPPRSLEHIELPARCAPPGPWQGGITQILQPRGAVVLVYENDHASRTIHLNGRPHVSPTIKLFMGDSIGRWEGNTLVVDTTNLNGKASYGSFGRPIPYYSDEVHVTERFTVKAGDWIDYEIVYDDPKLFTRPIRSVGYFFPADDGYELREETCVEGSYTLKNIFGF
jgi:hypothetical protein